jgi:hypothetical protein
VVSRLPLSEDGCLACSSGSASGTDFRKSYLGAFCVVLSEFLANF